MPFLRSYIEGKQGVLSHPLHPSRHTSNTVAVLINKEVFCFSSNLGLQQLPIPYPCSGFFYGVWAEQSKHNTFCGLTISEDWLQVTTLPMENMVCVNHIKGKKNPKINTIQPTSLEYSELQERKENNYWFGLNYDLGKSFFLVSYSKHPQTSHIQSRDCGSSVDTTQLSFSDSHHACSL